MKLLLTERPALSSVAPAVSSLSAFRVASGPSIMLALSKAIPVRAGRVLAQTDKSGAFHNSIFLVNSYFG